MKTKKSSKHLVLNKKTIARLNNMNDVKGGDTTDTINTCLSPPGGTFCIACYERPGDTVTENLLCTNTKPIASCLC